MYLRIDNIKLTEDDILVICFDGEIVVGHCRLLDNCSKLFYLYVHPTYRGKKVMDELINYSAALSKVKGNKKLYGSCKKELIPLYAKYGMRVISGPDDNDLFDLETELP